ncbi:MAG: DUF998 domain-containing protein [Candidatus Nezhaarchaeota archaeon]|nr:DUF998 domain-containing protein [Candidatus Nezhaarchaeota archaeon]MCX8142260.1 DUF998 domain-containing protein [Candidatus Nezhaarchaeota archaeon]MDW8050767.1 DUF998 domain-containing protein [Nitrososphaerota archaeon]
MRFAWRFSGVAAAVLAWIVIFLSISRNSWFDFFRHALSDLGGSRASDPWVYNVGLVITGILASIYALYLASKSTGKIAVYASAFIFIAGIFLALIGVFPSGTRPHTFVSTWFFIQMWMAVITSAISFLVEKEVKLGALLLMLSAVGLLGALLIDWPSVALLEVFGIILIDIYVITLTVKH